MTDTEDRFDWQHDPNIIVHEQLSLAVYSNTVGHVVIRCERRWDEEEDPFFTVAPEHAPVIAQAILRAAGLGEIEFIRRCAGGYEDVKIPTVQIEGPKDKTAAERQRRHRENKAQRDRDTVTDGVTDRDAPLLELVG